jgi:8-oxo-dGTP pyrophosphatase MutT (NUDIX family)
MSTDDTHGVINYTHINRKTDYLFRVSIKGLVRHDGKVLVVKETNRDWWDLPGGGMDHHESIKDALARELHEEVNLTGDFTYRVIAVEEPKLLDNTPIWQLRLIFEITPTNLTFTPGEDGDEVMFIDPQSFKDSDRYAERKIYEYARLV